MQQPSADVRRWVERSVGNGVDVVAWETLKAKKTQPTWLVHLVRHGDPSAVILKVSPIGWHAGVTAEANALQLAERLQLPAPRLLGVDTTGSMDELLLLETYLPGSNTPREESPLPRMRALGAAAARLHSVALPTDHGLPRVARPVRHDDYIADRRAGRIPGSAVIRAAERIHVAVTPKGPADALVHGDFHHGNVLWSGNTFIAYIDWDCAGVGHPEIDLSWARLEAALSYSPQAAEEITNGWKGIMGREPDSLGYWDIVAGLQTQADIGSRSGRRDDFLRAAFKRIGR